jgi:glycosyltransferase involved in cell wall biosynthesis
MPRVHPTAVPGRWVENSGQMSQGPLSIALVAPPWFPIPPEAYGGIEWVCFWLTEGLLERGHQVTLVACGKDQTSARYQAIFLDHPRGLGSAGEAMVEVLYAAEVTRFLADSSFDVVHDQSFAGPLTAGARGAPTIVTAHGPANGMFGDWYRIISRTVPLVAISEAQRRITPAINWFGTVHNGVRVADYPFREQKDDFVLFLGRMVPEKGAAEAIDAARRAGLPIVLAAKCSEPAELRYFEAEIAPRLAADTRWLGEANTAAKKDLLSRARCLLVPIRWEEPFGLTMIEAMACGTPVVAFACGAAPEIVAHGTTGFLCEDVEEMATFIRRVGDLDATDCRASVSTRFDSSVMVRRYETLYRQLITTWRRA